MAEDIRLAMNATLEEFEVLAALLCISSSSCSD